MLTDLLYLSDILWLCALDRVFFSLMKGGQDPVFESYRGISICRKLADAMALLFL
jgi:hypothetical protein